MSMRMPLLPNLHHHHNSMRPGSRMMMKMTSLEELKRCLRKLEANLRFSIQAFWVWKVQEPVLPLLADIARKYFCVPASSSPSERLFFASGNVCTKLRSSLCFSV